MGNDYKIIKQIGEGGFGNVQLIEKNNKYYALKRIFINKLKKEEIDKCKEEATILSNLDNEYIVKYYDSFIEKDYFNIMMEYAGDSNLKTFIKKYKARNNLIEEKLILNIMLQICLGLKAIHEAKIIHRDLKPENIFINEDNRIK